MPGWLNAILGWLGAILGWLKTLLRLGGAGLQWLLAALVWLLACFLSRTVMHPIARAMRRARLLRRPTGWEISDVQAAAEPPTPAELQWAKRAAMLPLEGLKDTRAAAEKWAASIAAVTGAIGVVSLIKGRESLDELDHAWEIAVGVLVGVAVLLALRGIVLAALAAQGTPARIEYTGAALRDLTASETEEAADLLRYSRVLIVAATLVAGSAVAIVWFAPEAEKPASLRLVLTDTGPPACGELKTGDGDTLTVGETTITVSQIRSISAVPSCPKSR